MNCLPEKSKDRSLRQLPTGICVYLFINDRALVDCRDTLGDRLAKAQELLPGTP
ncbi:hypothetical protein FHW68_004047 [Pseudomonas sp. Tn43]|nr:hypothetical protein [Pseudomonas sp. Tn43]